MSLNCMTKYFVKHEFKLHYKHSLHESKLYDKYSLKHEFKLQGCISMSSVQASLQIKKIKEKNEKKNIYNSI